MPYRYVWPAELDLMARIGGMRLRERWSGWHRTPFTGESALARVGVGEAADREADQLGRRSFAGGGRPGREAAVTRTATDDDRRNGGLSPQRSQCHALDGHGTPSAASRQAPSA